jgi:NADPH:quinone reductase-like Zn-dependent oxidoreductase
MVKEKILVIGASGQIGVELTLALGKIYGNASVYQLHKKYNSKKCLRLIARRVVAARLHCIYKTGYPA